MEAVKNPTINNSLLNAHGHIQGSILLAPHIAREYDQQDVANCMLTQQQINNQKANIKVHKPKCEVPIITDQQDDRKPS